MMRTRHLVLAAIGVACAGIGYGVSVNAGFMSVSNGITPGTAAAGGGGVDPPPTGWPQPPMPGMPEVLVDGETTYEVGFSTELLVSAAIDSTPADVGAFRLSCRPSHTNFDDAIVYPGDVGRAHNHFYFGNTAAYALTDLDNIRAVGNSTCAGGTANKSAYWVPSMIDTATGTVVEPHSIQVYYKSGYSPFGLHATVQALPPGLRMLAGFPMDNGSRGSYFHQFSCDWEGTPPQTEVQPGFIIPLCIGDDEPNEFQMGSYLRSHLDFPNCWDGVNIDSANHRSHMAYGNPESCPPTHPVLLPSIGFNVLWKIPLGVTTANWKLSDTMGGTTSGYSFHGDWVNGWDVDIEERWLDNCVRASIDCHSNNLQDGDGLDLPARIEP